MKSGLQKEIIEKFSKDLVETEYIKNKKSIRDLSRQFGINNRTVSKLLSYHKVKIRYGSEAIKSQREGEKGQKRRSEEFRRYKVITSDGYYSVLFPFYHKSLDRGRVKEHILIMEDKIGRRLKEKEVVHHIDGNKLNNDINNLQLMTASEHNKLHWEELEKDENGKIVGKKVVE